MSKRAGRHLDLLAAFVLVGCGSGDALPAAEAPGIDRPTVTGSDSAGVRILALSHVPPADDPDWEWGFRVTRSIPTVGGPDAEPVLFNPQQATRLGDGRIVIVDSGDPVLAVIEPGADTVGIRFGQEGQGPRELWGGLLVIWELANGGIAVADPPSHKVVHFARDGEFVTSLPTPARVLGDRAAWQFAERTGDLYAKNIGIQAGQRVDSVLAFRAGGEAPRPVAVFAAQPVDPTATRQLNWWSVLPSGVVILYHADRPIFHVTRPGGSRSEIRLPLTRAPMSEEETREVEEFLGGRRTEPLKTIGNGLGPFGDSAFVLEQFSMSTPAEDPEPDGTVWRMIGVAGDYRGVIRFPPGFSPSWTDGTDVIGFDRDSLDVATIQVMRLEPPPALR